MLLSTYHQDPVIDEAENIEREGGGEEQVVAAAAARLWG